VPLLLSSRDSYTRSVAPVAARMVEHTVEDVAGGNGPATAPVPGARVLGIAAEGRLTSADRPFRAVVIGDGDFASNSFLPYMSNSDLLLSTVRWLAREERTAAVAPRIPVPPLVALTGRQLNAIFLVTVLAMPLLVVVLGGAVWWRRR